MYSINMKLWDCYCGTGKNCGSCSYGTYHYCTKCNKTKPGHKEESCHLNKTVHFSSGPIYIPANEVYNFINGSKVIPEKKHTGLKPANKNGFVIIFNKSSNNNLYVLLQKRSSNNFVCPNGIGIPGGRKERDETDFEAAIRETYEETGYLLDINQLVKFRESKNCGWFMTTEYIYNHKLTKNQNFVELGSAPYIESPPGLAIPPYGHFWINIKDVGNYLSTQTKLIGLIKRIYEAVKYI